MTTKSRIRQTFTQDKAVLRLIPVFVPRRFSAPGRRLRLPTGQTPLDSQALFLPPLTARSRNLVRFARHLPIETMDESFAGDYAFRDAGSRFSLLKSPKTLPGPDECFGVFARDARPLVRKLLGLELGYPGLDAARAAKLCGYNAMSYYRSHVVEYFCHNGIAPMPPLEGDCVFWFAAADVNYG